MQNAKITTLPNGPLMVEGPLPALVDGEGKTIDLTGKDKVFLCRCGQSKNKPFCDGAHKAAGFVG